MDVKNRSPTGDEIPLILCYISLHSLQHTLRTKGERSGGKEKEKNGKEGGREKVENQHLFSTKSISF